MAERQLETIRRQGLEEQGLPADGEVLRRFRVYYENLEESNRVMNLTAITGEEDTARLPKRIGRETPEEVMEAARAQLLHGTIVLKTNRMGFDGQEAYRCFKAREDVEQLFDTYKVEEDFSTTAMHGPETLEAFGCFTDPGECLDWLEDQKEAMDHDL